MKAGDILEGLVIVDMAFGGEGIAKLQTEGGDFIVFVENTLPGQQVSAKILKKKKRYAQAKLVKVEKPSPDEIQLDFQRIPGAPFLCFPIEKQIQYKKHSTLEMFKRLAEMPDIAEKFDSYIASPSEWFYRNKMEYSFSALESDIETAEESWGFALGFKRRGQWWAVENLEKASGLFDKVLEDNLPKIRAFCQAAGLPAWDPAKQTGFFRFLVVRKSFAANKLLLNLVTTSNGLGQFDRNAFVDLLKSILGERLAGVWHTINDEVGDAAKQPSDATKLLFGEEKIVETILGLNFEISMQSFFQTNPKCAELLYSKAIEYVQEGLSYSSSDAQVAMDLFCGTGTIAQLLRKNTNIDKVIGVDIIEEAIEDAKENAKRNNISNIDFYAADVRKFLKEFPQYINTLGVVVIDPPRAGIVPKALLRIIELNAKAIVYISCNPSTQARDTLTLKQGGYVLKNFSLVDQFPHTAHIESVALFVKE